MLNSSTIRLNIYVCIIFSVLFTLIICSCKSTPEPQIRRRIPTTKTDAPRSNDDALLLKTTKWEKELSKDPENVQLLLLLAKAYVDLAMEDKAISSLERLVILNYNDEPRVFSTLGLLYRNRKDFKKSRQFYQTYFNRIDQSHSHFSQTSQIISELDYVISELEKKEIILFEPMTALNSEDQEYLPQFTIDESSIIFTRRWYGQEDLMYAQKKGETYQVDIIDELSTMQNEGAHTISSDGKKIVFTKCDNKFGYGSCDLYEAEYQDSFWLAPKNMGSRINSSAWESQPSLSADGRILYFSSTREGGLGGSDLWYCYRLADGRWSIPYNLGPEINSIANDESPFIHADGKTIYFRSDRKPSLGSYDIYMAKGKLDKWREVQNLGYPINSVENDGALVVSLNGTYGYYATDFVNGQATGNLDIVRFVLPEQFRPEPMTYFKARVTDQKTMYPILAKAELVDISTNEILNLVYTDTNGELLVPVPLGKEVLLNVSAKSYAFYSDHIIYKDFRFGANPLSLEIHLRSLPSGNTVVEKSPPIVLKNIFFKTGSFELLSQSQLEINYLRDLLMQNPSIHIAIVGHTDNVGQTEDNLQLSLKRVQGVKDELTKKGIDPKRIEIIAKGESEPIADNSLEEGRAVNRRIEFMIIK